MVARVKKNTKDDAEVIPKLTPARMKGGEYARNVYVARPESTVTPEQLTEPSFWSLVSGKVRAGDHIEVIPDDSSFYAELYVLAAGPTMVKAALIRLVKFAENGSDLIEQSNTDHPGYDIRWAGATEKFQVISKEDNKVLKSELDTKLAAAVWLDDFVKSMNR